MKALVAGFGSIGKRHAQILNDLNLFDEVIIWSSRAKELQKEPFRFIEQPDQIRNPKEVVYCVICSATNKHESDWLKLEEKFSHATVLIEKPLSKNPGIQKPGFHRVYTGYNMRFHLLVQRMEEWLKTNEALFVQMMVGQHLSQWNRERSYREMYRGSRAKGGGVLLDLSHELDLLGYFWPDRKVESTLILSTGTLGVDVQDLAVLQGKIAPHCGFTVHLDYLQHYPCRNYRMIGKDSTLELDFFNHTIRESNMEKLGELESLDYSYDESIQLMHKSIIEESGEESRACSFEKGLELLHFIEEISY